MVMKTMICKKCGKEKTLEEFVKNKLCRGGYYNLCKECYNKKKRDKRRMYKY